MPAHGGAALDAGGVEAARWPLVVIVALALVLVVALWVAVVFKVAAEERAEFASIERRTMNLARVFEEYTVCARSAALIRPCCS